MAVARSAMMLPVNGTSVHAAGSLRGGGDLLRWRSWVSCGP